MDKDQKTLEKLEKIFDVLEEDKVTTEEVAEAFSLIMQSLETRSSEFKEQIEEIAQLFLQFKKETSNESRVFVRELMNKISVLKVDLERKIKEVELTPGLPGKDAKPEDVAAVLKKDSAFMESIKGQPGDIKDLAPEEIRNSLELIKDEEEKLKISAIGYLRQELDELRKLVSKNTQTFVGGGGKGKVKSYDLSTSLNGVTKTFNLPAMWSVVSIHSTSSPIVFRPITDYTFTPTSVTFTSEINAATTLASGQSVIVVYEEA